MSAVEEYFELVDGERFDELLELFDPAAELIAPGTAPRTGREAIRDYYERAFAPYAEHRDEPTRIVAAGDVVLAEVHFRGVPASGEAIEFDAVDVFDLGDGGRIRRLSSWYDSHWVRSRLGRRLPGPTIEAGRVATATRALAEQAADSHLRVQLHSLAALVEQLGAQRDPRAAEPAAVDAEIERALAAGDEQRAIAVARGIAAAERSRAVKVDWSAAAGG